MYKLSRSARIFIVICLAGLFSQQAMAQSDSSDEWSNSLAVYLWGAGIGGTTSQGSGVSVDFKDIVDNLEFAFMGSYQGRKGKWSILTDINYLDVSGDRQQTIIPPIGEGNVGLGVNANLDMKTWVVHAAGGYNLYDDREGTTTDVVFGARYLDLSTDLLIDFDIVQPEFGPTLPLSASEDVLDAIVGMRGVISLGDRWFIPWGGNIGAGTSDLSWQAHAGLAFRASSWADIALTYRYLKWELDADLVDDLSISGPLLGVVFRF
jgi:hypothetical protein